MTRARDLSQVLNDVGSISTNDIANGAVTQVKLDSNINLGVRVASVAYPGDDTAADPAGGQTVTITGAGFAATPTVYIDSTLAPSVTYVSPTQITFVTPAKSAGTYNLFVINPDGSTAISVMGISYSGTPAWTTPAGSLGYQNAAAISFQLIATGDTPLVYSLTSGSTLPSGVTLSSSGLISGSVPTAQTFSFSVDVTDPQYQTTPRSFSITVTVGEPYFQYVTLLLHGNQPSGVTDTNNNVFKDSSTNGFTITRNGNTTQGTFTPFSKPDGRWGNYFDGTGDFLSFTGSSATNFNGVDWTIECWFFKTVLSGGNDSIIQSTTGTNSWVPYLALSTNNDRTIGVSLNATNYSSTQTYNLNEWNHVAVVRSGGVIKVYLNGAATSISVTADITNSNLSFWIGKVDNAPGGGGYLYYFNGYISNLRILKGTAQYTSAFTPPAAPLTAITNTSLLTCQSNRFIDNSTNAFAITRNGDVSVQTFSPFPVTTAYAVGTNGGSGYFDGNGDNLVAASNAAFALGTGDFTVETFAYYSALANVDASAVINWDGVTWGSNKWSLHLDHSTARAKVTFWVHNINSGAAVLTSTTTTTVGQWYHIAVTRSGNTFRLFINGALEATATSSVSLDNNTNSPIYVGGGGGGGGTQYFNGYLSSTRLVKGTAQYTAAFTPPTAPLAAASGTSLLLNFTNAAIIDNSMSNDLETVGNASISTVQSKWGGGSMYFDGSGDYLFSTGAYSTNPQSLNFELSKGDFTIEFWFRANTVSPSLQGLVVKFSGNATARTDLQFNIGLSGSTLICNAYQGTTNNDINFTSAISTNTWYHVALVRQGNTVSAYLDGTKNATTRTISGNLNGGTNWPLYIGHYTEGGVNYGFNGYIDDLRITKGYARYTANFTPPTGPFDDNGV